MNGLSLFNQQRSTHCFVVTLRWFDEVTLPEELTDAENNRAMLPQHVGEWTDESKCPEKVEEGDIAENCAYVKEYRDMRCKFMTI